MLYLQCKMIFFLCSFQNGIKDKEDDLYDEAHTRLS